jgi:hypothetical protein
MHIFAEYSLAVVSSGSFRFEKLTEQYSNIFGLEEALSLYLSTYLLSCTALISLRTVCNNSLNQHSVCFFLLNSTTLIVIFDAGLFPSGVLISPSVFLFKLTQV